MFPTLAMDSARLKVIFRYLLALTMVGAGLLHFTSPDRYVRIMPAYLPAPHALVLISGFFEIVGGVAVIIPRLRVAAGWGLIALYIAVFPANINAAIHHLSIGNAPVAPALPWLRLPLQLVFIAWAHWMTRPDVPADVSPNSAGAASSAAESVE